MIHIFNSMTREKEALQPLKPGHISMYVCGDTTYDLAHMGHARSKIAFDVIRRYLSFSGYVVTFVRNITDVDDKIIKRAAERQENIEAFTERYVGYMHRDYDALGIMRPDHEPRATGYIPGMVEMTSRLIDKGFAYVSGSGDVLFAVRKFAAYGALSGEQLDELSAGERVAVDATKRDPLDFVLWKMAKPGEPSWPSPWGAGRPGWHIECSAMSESLLGTRFDIHGGGMDLKFPHHENEIAQSCAASGDSFARVWMHNGFLTVDDEKMSKSLGNAFTIVEALKRVRHAEVIRYFIVSSHYRGPVNYTLEQLTQATAALERIYSALRDVGPAQPSPVTRYTEAFRAAMDDDFNTPEAVAVLQTMTRDLNVAKREGKTLEAARIAAELGVLAGVLGVAQLPPEQWARLRTPPVEGGPDRGTAGDGPAAGETGVPPGLSDAAIDEQVTRRLEARKNKDFKEADRIRDSLAAQGVILEDRPGGRTEWRRA
ncbi:MAG TPA: cysteine--tRNA ligase [Steroidobacteraceae bacterium]|nr:cysteine--tRNA ligase [Steroidobacteraceae bacterium]